MDPERLAFVSDSVFPEHIECDSIVWQHDSHADNIAPIASKINEAENHFDDRVRRHDFLLASANVEVCGVPGASVGAQ